MSHAIRKLSSPDFLEPFRAKIHALNVWYLRNGRFDGGTMEDVLNVQFFLKSFPNPESLRWSCRYFGGQLPPFLLPQELFGSFLPRLQRLSMVNCWGLLLTDTPVLKAMSMEPTGEMNQVEIFISQLVHWLRRRQSLVSLSLANFYINPDANNPPTPCRWGTSRKSLCKGWTTGLWPVTPDAPQQARPRPPESHLTLNGYCQSAAP